MHTPPAEFYPFEILTPFSLTIAAFIWVYPRVESDWLHVIYHLGLDTKQKRKQENILFTTYMGIHQFLDVKEMNLTASE